MNDLSGLVFGKLTVLGYSHSVKHRYWRCQCACGKEAIVRGQELTRHEDKATRSCGCSAVKHGESRRGNVSKEYRAWTAMLTRCNNQNADNSDRYLGRGIKVCDSWQSSFEDFLSDMGRAPSANHSIDRRNNDGDYEPSNCRWATIGEQSRNTRRSIFIEIDGVRLCLKDWATKTGTKPRVLYQLMRQHGILHVTEKIKSTDLSQFASKP